MIMGGHDSTALPLAKASALSKKMSDSERVDYPVSIAYELSRRAKHAMRLIEHNCLVLILYKLPFLLVS